ncbi:hypothetical protein [Streptomyces qinglanensis]|uniref:hypothetical protein n=1 Tax=Streptomyces qinglanensis TaxID=943816 RepID=UPI00116092FB|nr:hypothetical protein [Streptomyces qinglanensis]
MAFGLPRAWSSGALLGQALVEGHSLAEVTAVAWFGLADAQADEGADAASLDHVGALLWALSGRHVAAPIT